MDPAEYAVLKAIVHRHENTDIPEIKKKLNGLPHTVKQLKDDFAPLKPIPTKVNLLAEDMKVIKRFAVSILVALVMLLVGTFLSAALDVRAARGATLTGYADSRGFLTATVETYSPGALWVYGFADLHSEVSGLARVFPTVQDGPLGVQAEIFGFWTGSGSASTVRVGPLLELGPVQLRALAGEDGIVSVVVPRLAVWRFTLSGFFDYHDSGEIVTEPQVGYGPVRVEARYDDFRTEPFGVAVGASW